MKWLFLAASLSATACQPASAVIAQARDTTAQAVQNVKDANDVYADTAIEAPCGMTLGALSRRTNFQEIAGALDLCWPDWRDVLAAASVANQPIR